MFLTVGPVREHQHRSSTRRSATSRSPSTCATRRSSNALAALTASTRTFYRVTAPRTITIIPDTPAKRREYEESIIRTFFLSNADLKETIDLLRVVIDIRQISPITRDQLDLDQGHARAHRRRGQADHRHRQGAARSRHRRRAARGGSHASSATTGCRSRRPGSPGISGSVDINRDNFTLANLKNLTAADVFLSGIPGLYYRLLKNDTATRTLANPQLRTAEGLTATARFGEEVPVPVTTFAPIAAGGVNTQPITSFTYRERRREHRHHAAAAPRRRRDAGAEGHAVEPRARAGFGGLPTFGNREITTTIRLKDGETNMLAGLIRDEERTVLSGVPGLSDIPLLGRLFANNHRETQQTDIILTLTPHIVRVLDLTEADLRPFRLGREVGDGVARRDSRRTGAPPRDEPLEPAAARTAPPAQPPALPAPRRAGRRRRSRSRCRARCPGRNCPVSAPSPKKPGGGGGSAVRRSSFVGS